MSKGRHISRGRPTCEMCGGPLRKRKGKKMCDRCQQPDGPDNAMRKYFQAGGIDENLR